MDPEPLGNVDLNVHIEGVPIALQNNFESTENVEQDMQNRDSTSGTEASVAEKTEELIPHDEQVAYSVFPTDANGQIVFQSELLEQAKDAAATFMVDIPQGLEEDKKENIRIQPTSPTTIASDEFPVDVPPIGGDPFTVGAALDTSENYYKASSQSLRFPPVQLEWKNLEYIVKVGPPFKKRNKIILHKMNGYVAPGEVLAIMGPSGAGKTSLLNILAQRVRRYKADYVNVNGSKVGKSFRSLSAFVQQDDVLMGNLKVKEVLVYASLLRLPTTVPIKEKLKRVKDIIIELGLEKCANTKVGIPGLSKGISGGERKRLAIGVELLSGPSVLFLDEPTSGLDAKSSLGIINTIRKLALAGRSVILTIHQPRSDIFMLFDRLLLLSRGKVAYFGKAADAIPYFSSIGYPCPVEFNPADFLMDLLAEGSSDTKTGKEQKEIDNQRITHILQNYEESIAPTVVVPPLASDAVLNLKKLSAYNSIWPVQFFVILARSFTNIIRDKVLTFSRLFQTIIMALLVGLLYLQLGKTQTGVQNRIGAMFFILVNSAMNSMFTSLLVFPQEKAVMMRERSSKTYRTSAYFVAKSAAELPNLIFFPLLFSVIAYWMVGLNPAADRFFIFCGIIILVALTAQSFGLLIAAIASSDTVANTIAPFFITFFLLFGGFYLNLNNMPVWGIPFYWLSFFHYGFEALVVNEFSGLDFHCLPTEFVGLICPITNGDTVLKAFAMNGPFSVHGPYLQILYCALMLLLLLIVLRVLAYFGLLIFKKPRGG